MAKGKGSKIKSARQVRFLMSKGSPLTVEQKQKLIDELHSGAVRMTRRWQ